MKFIVDKSLMEKEMPTFFNYPELRERLIVLRRLEQSLFDDWMEIGLEFSGQKSCRTCK